MLRYLLLMVVGWLMIVSTCSAQPANPLSAVPAAGVFSDGSLTVDLSGAQANQPFVASLALGGNQFQARATVNGQNVNGTFNAGGQDYPFTSTLAGDTLTLSSGGKTYQLKRQAGQAAAGGDLGAAPGGMTELRSIPAGRALFANLQAANSIEDALSHTIDALAPSFDAKPKLDAAFSDKQTQHRGGATFTGSIQSKPVHGVIFVSLAPKSVATSVVYADAKASAADVATLMDALPAQAKMKPHPFPDGSGTVDLPDGWTTQTQSLGAPLIIDGPDQQHVLAGLALSINTPNCQLIRLAEQTYQMKVNNYRQMLAMRQQTGGFGPPPPQPGPPPDPARDFPQLIFCHYCKTPDEVMKDLMPILQQRTLAAGKPHMETTRVIEEAASPPTPGIQNSNAAILYYAGNKIDGQKVTAMRCIDRLETAPIFDGSDSWMLFANELTGPDATFDRDLPVMQDIFASVHVDEKWLAAKQKADSDRIQQQGEAFREQMTRQHNDFMAAQNDRFNRFESTMAARSQAMHDSSSDFIEMIRGVRDVYDTRTGQTGQVDLSNANGIVQSLNDATNDPNRFVQIPLRYQR